MVEYEFEDSVGHWICATAHAYERSMNEELAPQGITWRQCQVLGWLALDGPISQVELADRMNIEPPTLVRILDCMERGGLIERGPCAGDRRRKMISPLPGAEALWRRIVQCARGVRARATHGLSPQQLQTLRELLVCVQENLESPTAWSH